MKTILLTGAKGGIGSAIAAMLTNAGYEVTIVDRNDADIASFEDLQTLQQKMSAEGKTFDWIVCAHGYVDTQMNLEEQDPEAIRKTFEVNSLSLFYIAKLFLKMLRPQGGMIFISSTAGTQANGRLAAYSASKAAVNSFAQALARNRAEFNFFSICPGPTNTQMRERLAGDAAKMQSPDVIAEVVKTVIEGPGDYKSGDIITVRDGQTTVTGNI